MASSTSSHCSRGSSTRMKSRSQQVGQGRGMQFEAGAGGIDRRGAVVEQAGRWRR